MELDVLGIALVFTLGVVDGVILAQGIIDADGIQPEAVLALTGLVKVGTVANRDSDLVSAIFQLTDLHHRDLVEGVGIIGSHFPLAGNLIIGVAVVVIDQEVLVVSRVGRIHTLDIHHDSTGGIVSQGNDVKARTLKSEGSGGVRSSSRVDRGLPGAAHGELRAVRVGVVITVGILLAAKLLQCLVRRGRLESPLHILRPAILAELHEAVLIVNRAGGDDSDIELHRTILRAALILRNRSGILYTEGIASVNWLRQCISNVITAVRLDISVSRLARNINRSQLNTSAAKCLAQIRRLNHQRKAKIHNEGALCVEGVVQVNILAVCTTPHFHASIVTIAVLCADSRNLLQVCNNRHSLVRTVEHSVVNQFKAIGCLLREPFVENSVTLHGNRIVIELGIRRSAVCILLTLQVVNRQRGLALPHADIISNKIAILLRHINGRNRGISAHRIAFVLFLVRRKIAEQVILTEHPNNLFFVRLVLNRRQSIQGRCNIGQLIRRLRDRDHIDLIV